MSKKFLLGLVLLCGSVAAMADEYKYLLVKSVGAEQSISLASVHKITFADAKVVVTTSAGVFTYLLAEMDKMSFSADVNAIEALPEKTDGLAYANGTLSVNGKGTLRIYNAAGALVQMATVQGQCKVSMNGMKPGLYIVNLGEESIKVIK